MIMQAERELIVEYGKKLITQGLTTGTGGNISIFDRKTRLMAMSPSGVDYFETRPQDVAIINVDTCEKIDGEFKPSVEYLLHRIFYVERDDIALIWIVCHRVGTNGWSIVDALEVEKTEILPCREVSVANQALVEILVIID